MTAIPPHEEKIKRITHLLQPSWGKPKASLNFHPDKCFFHEQLT